MKHISLLLFAVALSSVAKSQIQIESTYTDFANPLEKNTVRGTASLLEFKGKLYAVSKSRWSQGGVSEGLNTTVLKDTDGVSISFSKRLANNLQDIEVFEISDTLLAAEKNPLTLESPDSSEIVQARIVQGRELLPRLKNQQDTSAQIHPDVWWQSRNGKLFRSGEVNLRESSVSFLFSESPGGLLFKKLKTPAETVSAFRIFEPATNTFHLVSSRVETLDWLATVLKIKKPNHLLYWYDVNPINSDNAKLSHLMWLRWKEQVIGEKSPRPSKFTWRKSSLKNQFQCHETGTSAPHSCTIAVHFHEDDGLLDVTLDLGFETLAFRLGKAGGQVWVSDRFEPQIAVKGSRGNIYTVDLEGFLITSVASFKNDPALSPMEPLKTKVRVDIRQGKRAFVIE